MSLLALPASRLMFPLTRKKLVVDDSVSSASIVGSFVSLFAGCEYTVGLAKSVMSVASFFTVQMFLFF